jgi:endonuclease/exonuclease/phosphatase family metal-dependent hydrolase
LKTEEEFVIINTHFDHVGKESRKNAAALLKERAAKLGKDLPVIITGDFNFTREAPPYEVMMDPSGVRLIDTAPANAPGTSCGFELNARQCNGIDYIFHTPQWTADHYQVIQDNDGKYYPSDHLPVIADLSLRRK